MKSVEYFAKKYQEMGITPAKTTPNCFEKLSVLRHVNYTVGPAIDTLDKLGK